MGTAELVSAMADELRAERVSTTHMYLAAGRLAQVRIAESGEDKVQWCVDGREGVAAEVSAELGISAGHASTVIQRGLTLLEHFPRLAAVCLAGEVDLLATLDAELARRAPLWTALSREKVAQLIDWMVIDVDPDALRVSRQAELDRHIEVGPSKDGGHDVLRR